MVELGLSGDVGIWVPIQEDQEASLFQPVNDHILAFWLKTFPL